MTDQGDIDEGGIGVVADPSSRSRSGAPTSRSSSASGPADGGGPLPRRGGGRDDHRLRGAPLRADDDRPRRRGRLASPLDQSFWVAEADGRSAAETTWKIRDGSYRIVVMNADGSPGIAVDGEFGVHVPRLTAIATTALAGGLILVVSGIVLVVAGARSKDTPAPQEPASPYVAVRI